MKLLRSVIERLDHEGIAHAVIGAAALAAHGIARSTGDLDLLVSDLRTLQTAMWEPLARAGARIDARRGDSDDPLLGVVRCSADGDVSIDIVVAGAPWQQRAIERATPEVLAGVPMRVATARDLVLLKLYAGAPQDRWDILRLLETASGHDDLVDQVESDLPALPAECRATWSEVLEARRRGRA